MDVRTIEALSVGQRVTYRDGVFGTVVVIDPEAHYIEIKWDDRDDATAPAHTRDIAPHILGIHA
jgi:preprotein translocase subunit YajC